MVKTAGRKYARGHSPTSHTDYEARGKAISSTVHKKYAAGYVNPFTGRQHSKSTKTKMSQYAKNRPSEHQENLDEGIRLRSDNPVWVAAARANFLKGSKVHADMTRGVPRIPVVKKKISRTRSARIKAGLIQTWNKGIVGAQVAWNLGLTKKTHPGMLSISKQLKAAYASGEKEIQSRADWIKWYDGPNGKIRMRSGYELGFALWCDRKEIKWQYEPKRFPVKVGRIQCTYTPDFCLVESGCYVEIKGRLTTKEMKKYGAFQKQHPEIQWVLMMGEGLLAIGALPLRVVA